MEPSVGDTVRGRYDLTEHLGDGGFSTVWRARDREGERDVALKFPAVKTHDSELVLGRFEQERAVLEPFTESLSHATVVQYLDGDLEAEPRFLALEYLSGDPLVDTFGTGTLGTGVRRRIITDLAETLDFLHRNGVVYLDLKPENVVVRRSGRPVLLDFNTAVRRDERIETRFEADQFKAPELLGEGAGEPDTAGPWSDVYSWGKLAFYLLTGAKVLTENVPPDGLDPRTFGSSCPAALAEVVERATRPRGHERYENGPALATAVARATGRGPRTVLVHADSGLQCAVGDGDTLGRSVPGERLPWAVVADPEGHIAPRHASFERTPQGWEIEDASLNGTYVGGKDGWTVALSEAGYRKQREQGTFDPDRPQPPSSVSLEHGSVVAPVHPRYGVRVHVALPDRRHSGENSQ